MVPVSYISIQNVRTDTAILIVDIHPQGKIYIIPFLGMISMSSILLSLLLPTWKKYKGLKRCTASISYASFAHFSS
jgi:hypothetical protein